MYNIAGLYSIIGNLSFEIWKKLFGFPIAWELYKYECSLSEERMILIFKK